MASSMLDPVAPSRAVPNLSSPHPNPHPLHHHRLPSSPPLSGSASLSSNSSFGVSTSKVGKRKARGISKPPIKFFAADVENFMDMVQSLTGISGNSLVPMSSAQDFVVLPQPAGVLDPYVGLHQPPNKVLRFSRFKPSADQRQQMLTAVGRNSTMEGGPMTSVGFSSVPTAVDSRSLSDKQCIGSGTAGDLPYAWDGSEAKNTKQDLQYPWDLSAPKHVKREFHSNGGATKSDIGLFDECTQGELSENHSLFGDSAWALLQSNC